MRPSRSPHGVYPGRRFVVAIALAAGCGDPGAGPDAGLTPDSAQPAADAAGPPECTHDGWLVELPASDWAVADRTATVVDKAGRVHVLFRGGDPAAREGGATLLHAEKTAAGWRLEPVDASGDVGNFLAASVDEDDGIHAAYYDRIAGAESYVGDLKLAERSPSGAWTVSTLDSAGNSGLVPSVVARAGVLHVAYLRDGSRHGELVYARRGGDGEWNFEVVGQADFLAERTALAVESTGVVHLLSYLDDGAGPGVEPDHGTLRHATRAVEGAWSHEVLDADPSVGLYVAAAIDREDGVHVSYFDYNDSGLRYGYRPQGGAWSTDEIDAVGGGHSSITAAPDGAIHLVDLDYGARKLRHRSGPLGGSFDDPVVVDPDSESGWFASVAVGPSGAIHVSYVDFWNAQLRFATRCASP